MPWELLARTEALHGLLSSTEAPLQLPPTPKIQRKKGGDLGEEKGGAAAAGEEGKGELGLGLGVEIGGGGAGGGEDVAASKPRELTCSLAASSVRGRR